MPLREGEQGREFPGRPGEFPGQQGEFPGRGPEGTMSPVSPARPMMPPADMNPEEFMREFKQKAERGEIQSGKFIQGGPMNVPQGGTMEPPHESIPGEFQRPLMTGSQPSMPGFVPQQGNFTPPDGGFAPPPQGNMMPPTPESSGGFVPPTMPAPMPMTPPTSGDMQAPPPPPPPPPTSQLNPRSFIGLLYSALRELIAK